MFPAFPKIWHLGTPQVEGLFSGVVEVTEKVDGSQFACGFDEDGNYRLRSKGAEIQIGHPPDLFKGAHDWAMSILETEKILPRMVFYGEAVQKPKHNVLKYNRTPKNHFAMFGAKVGERWLTYSEMKNWAEYLECDIVPLVFPESKIDSMSPEFLETLLETESFLGGQKIEGVVVKNWNKAVEWKGIYLPLTAAKFVSERFKEVHSRDWNKENTAKGGFEVLKENYRTEARWEKAVQHLRDSEELEQSPRDIGKLIAEIKRDIAEEEKEYIKDQLWRIFSNDILRNATRGFPEWYKFKLVEGNP